MAPNKQLDQLFENARNTPPQVSFNDIQSQFISATSAVSTSGASTLFTTKIMTIMMTTVLTVGGVFAYLSGWFISPDATDKAFLKREKESWISLSVSPKIPVFEENNIDDQGPSKVGAPLSSDTQLAQPTPVLMDTLKYEPSGFELKGTAITNHFPHFTEEEKKKYRKHKSTMIKEWRKANKNLCFIPSGSVVKGTDTLTLQAFYMAPTEVTNLAYRTFMFDLLEQGRKSDYLTAKPDQNQWLKMYPDYNAPMATFYFTHPAYDHYPVNNISRTGAQLYCTWLTTEVNKVLREKNKAEIAAIRIPYEAEWTYAANGGLKRIDFPWGGPYARNAKGCYLANFNPEGAPPDEDGAMQTAPVHSYSPNGFGLFCMSGNVAEMVVEKSTGTIGTKGGSFLSNTSEIKIAAPLQNAGVDSAQVDIGFRVVSSYLGGANR